MSGSVTGSPGLLEISRRPGAAAVARALPLAAFVVGTCVLAWRRGSIAAADWLPWAVLGALVLATVLLSGTAVRPTRVALAGLAGLVGLAVWATISLAWSPEPQLARDE